MTIVPSEHSCKMKQTIAFSAAFFSFGSSGTLTGLRTAPRMEVGGVDTCMLKEYLEKNYGYNEPIFINEIRLDGLNDNALRSISNGCLSQAAWLVLTRGFIIAPKRHGC